jgi:aminoglycoside 2'-N-acetyltransferase I
VNRGGGPVPKLETARTEALPPVVHDAILALCHAAYGEDLAPLFRAYGPGLHVLGRAGGELVTHAMWLTRWLQPGGSAPLRTAYVEAVATHPDHQRRGYASAAMRRLVETIPDDHVLAALSPATRRIYERLGWRLWEGPLAIRMPDGTTEPTPHEEVMVLELPGRPRLDRTAPLSAEWRAGELW